MKPTRLLMQPRGAWLTPGTSPRKLRPSEAALTLEEKGKVVVLWMTCLYDRSVTLTSQKGPLSYFEKPFIEKGSGEAKSFGNAS